MPVPSSYLNSLPAIFSEDPFLGQFLLAFEQVLTGLDTATSEPKQGLEDIVNNLSKLFDPSAIDTLFTNDEKTLKAFLQWLAGWTALSLRADWDTGQQQRFLAQIVPLYRQRGTKENLAELLKIYTGLLPIIEEAPDRPFQVGVNSTIFSTINTNTPQIGGGVPHYFRVTAYMPFTTPTELERQRVIIRALVDLQKPAHTYYDLTILTDTMQIGRRSTVGVNTLLGSIPTA
ncbi:phage tail protein [Phormidesmis priestleyi]